MLGRCRAAVVAGVLAMAGCADAGTAGTTTSRIEPTTSAPSAAAAPSTTVRAAATTLTTMAATTTTIEATVTPTVSTTSDPTTTAIPTIAPPTTTTAASTTSVFVPVYVFPFTGRAVSYGTTHHDYPAADVFGCGAQVVAPTSGSILETETVDSWDPAVDDPATRGGKFVSMLGDDGVRYYFAHLASVAVVPGDEVEPGRPLGVMGQTGNARASVCHTHVGISWVCAGPEWEVRRGEIWPAPYLDAWRGGEQRSPAAEVRRREAESPTACEEALAAVGTG